MVKHRCRWSNREGWGAGERMGRKCCEARGGATQLHQSYPASTATLDFRGKSFRSVEQLSISGHQVLRFDISFSTCIPDAPPPFRGPRTHSSPDLPTERPHSPPLSPPARASHHLDLPTPSLPPSAPTQSPQRSARCASSVSLPPLSPPPPPRRQQLGTGLVGGRRTDPAAGLPRQRVWPPPPAGSRAWQRRVGRGGAAAVAAAAGCAKPPRSCSPTPSCMCDRRDRRRGPLGLQSRAAACGWVPFCCALFLPDWSSFF